MEENVPHFFKEIRERSKLQFVPFNDLYLAHLVFFVLFIGGAGIWISAYQEYSSETTNIKNLTINIGTYYLALITTSYIDIISNEKIVNKKSLNAYSFILLITIALIFALTFVVTSSIAILLSILGVIIALFIWHLANCDNEKYNDASYSAKMKKEAQMTHGKSW